MLILTFNWCMLNVVPESFRKMKTVMMIFMSLFLVFTSFFKHLYSFGYFMLFFFSIELIALQILLVYYISQTAKWTQWVRCTHTRTHSQASLSLFCSSNQTHPLVVRRACRGKQNTHGCFLKIK